MKKHHSWFWGVVQRYTPLYGHVIIASVVVNLLSLSMPLFVMNVYDRIVPNNAFESLWVLSIGMFIAAILDFSLRIARMRFVDVAGRNADIKLQAMFMKSLLDVRFDALNKNPSTSSIGAIMARVRELEYVRDFLGSNTVLALADFPFVILFIGLIFYLGGSMGFVPVIAIPLLACFAYFVQNPLRQSSMEQMRTGAEKQSFLAEMVSSLETIRLTRMERPLLQHWDQAVTHSADALVVNRALTNITSYGMVVFSMILSVVLVIIGVYRISEGLMSTGGLIACVIVFGRCAAPMNGLVNILANYQKTRMTLHELDALLHLPSENACHESLNTHMPDGSTAVPIRFEKVAFSYPTTHVQTMALRDINFIFHPGAKVGFIGATGSGKSTLARLFSGLYQPTEGRIMLGRLDMKDMPMRPFRNSVGFLPQDIRIFRGTIRQNIAMAWPFESPCPEEEVLNAAHLAGVLEFTADHPLGLDMPIGERGTGLSGGQAQSVALARALLGNPHTLILDEPAAQIDGASEQRLVQRLAPILVDKTVILFTHKATMLQLVNKVVALDKGLIVWEGTVQDAVKKITQ